MRRGVDGLAGKKEALVDDIYFDIVTDSSTRIAGVYDWKVRRDCIIPL